jgi:hypothetical protein
MHRSFVTDISMPECKEMVAVLLELKLHSDCGRESGLVTFRAHQELCTYCVNADVSWYALRFSLRWLVAPCGLVSVYQCFRGLHSLHHQDGDRPEGSHFQM